MKKFVYNFYKFMYGRYGVDELYKCILCICFFIVILNIFVNSRILSFIELVLVIVLLYRTMSKNLVRRRYENKKYLSFRKKIFDKYLLIKKRWNDRDSHLYKKCPKCKTILRLPLKKGKHTCKCPNCGNRFVVRCNRDEKINVEVIKKK